MRCHEGYSRAIAIMFSYLDDTELNIGVLACGSSSCSCIICGSFPCSIEMIVIVGRVALIAPLYSRFIQALRIGGTTTLPDRSRLIENRA